jgi:hypothetical protein
MLARALNSHQKAGLVKDELWLENALSFLGLCAADDSAVDDGALGLDVLMGLDGKERTVEGERRKEYLTGLDKGEPHRYNTLIAVISLRDCQVGQSCFLATFGQQ